MKKTKLFLLTLLSLFLGGVNAAWADTYTVDFNTAINTSSHDFVVAPKWKHIVQDNDGFYVSYKWDAAYGANESGGLLVYKQKVGSSSYDEATVYDLLVTPKVSGTIKLKVKANGGAGSSNYAYVQLWSLNEAATAKDTQLKEFKTEIPGYDTGSNTEWVELSYNVTGSQRIGIRAQYVYIDDFYADAIDTTPEPALVVSEVMNSDGVTGTSGTNPKFEQQSDGTTMKVVLKVLLTNTGDVDFVAGTTENYTLTVGQASYTSGEKTFYEDASIAIPENLAAGESKTFDVEFNTPYVSGYKYWFVRENVTGTISTSYRYATSVPYESKFVLREAGSSSTSSLTSLNWGIVSEAVTKNLEVANTGTAPLTISASTLLTPPAGFTLSGVSLSSPLPDGVKVDFATQSLIIAGGHALPFSITNTTTPGTYSGTLSFSYTPANGTATPVNVSYAATVIAPGTWMADFNNSTSVTVYPEGSIAEGGISTDYQYTSGNYNYWLIGRSTSSYQTENNKFITPKLHADAGDKLAFDVKAGYSSSDAYYVKVYVSTDRLNWGEPVETYVYSTVGSSFTTKTISFDAAGDYYVAFALYGSGSGIDNLVGLEKVDVTHDLYIKEVTWPDASIKSGTAQSSRPTVKVIPLTDEVADAYTVKYVSGETVLATVDSKNLTHSVSSTTDFLFTWTPVVENTTLYEDTKVVFEFTDGTKFETETFDLTVTNEPIFHFVKTLPSSKWNEPSDYTTPITFGKTNTADAQSFYVYNWGSAPLTVKSITAPAGFTATPAEQFTVAAFDENDMSVAAQAVEITFSATAAGTYSGNLVVTYVNGAGADVTFSIAVSGTKLDPNKWYANFDNPTTSGAVWPAGSVYQGIDASSGNYSAPYNYYLTGTGSFITPKLTATAGEKLLFDAKLYSSSWSEGKVVVYAAATREEVLNAEEGTTRTQLFSVSGQDTENPMTTDYQTFEVSVPAGDWYLGFEISGRPYVDELYGLKLADVAHDWALVSSSIPDEAMQNITVNASVNIANFGLTAEAAGSYNVTVYVDEEPVATLQPETALPTVNKLSVAGTQISVPFIYGVVGTFPVYIEVEADGYKVKTEAVNVNFTGEIAGGDGIQVGTQSSTGRDYGFVDWYNNDGSTTRYTDILYPASKITAAGIKAGDKITAISFKASNSSKTFKAVVTSWVGMSTGDITYGSPDKSNMAEVSVYNGSVEFPANFESVINLTTPIEWDGTSDIRVYTEAVGQGSGNWISASYAYDEGITMSYNGTSKYGPVAFFTLAIEPATLTGTVTDGTNPVEGATVTLKAENGVQYSGTTDAAGEYSINVIQTGLSYNVTATNGEVSATGRNVSFADGNVTKNFVLGTISLGDVPEPAIYAKVVLNRALKRGWNAVVLPFAVSAKELATACGGDDGIELAEYDYDEGDTEVIVIFKDVDTVEANVPFLLYLPSEDRENPEFANVDLAADEAEAVTKGNVFDFVGVYHRTDVYAGDYFIQGGKFVKASTGNYVLPYRSYLKLKDTAGARSIRFVIGDNQVVTAINGLTIDATSTEGAYNLQGQKVEQLKKGNLYIINGKKVLVK